MFLAVAAVAALTSWLHLVLTQRSDTDILIAIAGFTGSAVLAGWAVSLDRVLSRPGGLAQT